MPSTEQLEALPTLAQGHVVDLKIDDGEFRISLSRCDAADGEPFDNTVYVEALFAGRWLEFGYYDGDDPIESIDFVKHAVFIDYCLSGERFAEWKDEAERLIGL